MINTSAFRQTLPEKVIWTITMVGELNTTMQVYPFICDD